MIRIDDLEVFVNAARSGSFSAAARALDITPAWASGAVQRLERELGSRLFVRSTRNMRLSEEGERYLPHAQAILAAVAEGRQALVRPGAEIAGPLRLSMPSDLGRNIVLPWLDEFQRLYPKITLHLRVSDQMADFFQQALDAGLRYGQLSDSSLVSLPIAPGERRVLCASPEYVARHGRPRTPDDLSMHNCLRYVLKDQTYERWKFHLPEGAKTISVKGDRLSDDAELVRRWAVAGLGVAYKSRIDIWPDLKAGRLVELFPPQYGDPVPLQLVAAHRASISPVIQRLRGFLVEKVEALMNSPT